ncbi:MAG TPA: tryptophan--tRNA ligase [Candidatus Acidoferrales bacterium]|nr:tryptophan--tRNA ligase [Candidatus Acidoferrales bacterium]
MTATTKTKKARVLSGMRPTGRLHIGHYFGALQNWIRMQDEYDCFFFVADWHALTTHYADSSQVASNTLEVATDWLAVGLDPKKATLFIQSSVPEHAELHLLLSMITPLSWLERVPTYKEQIENLRDKDLGTYGFLGYPLLQGADIVMYGEPKQRLLVPVGEDQAPHIEMTREIVRRFNFYFGAKMRLDIAAVKQSEARGILLTNLPPGHFEASSAKNFEPTLLLSHARSELGLQRFLEILRGRPDLFTPPDVLREPDVILTDTPRLPGTDGRRMAKSYNNAIWLSDPPDEIRAKVRNIMTDPQRVRRTDPGRPEVCPVFAYHKLFSDAGTIAMVDRDCRTAAIGCVDCKKLMADALVKWIEPVQARRRKFEAHPEEVWATLDAGSKQARKVATKTMKRVRKAIFNWDEARKAGPATQSGTKAAATD